MKQTVVHNVKRIDHMIVGKVRNFYKRDDISRVTPSVRETTKKFGARRYMNFPFKVAYRIFKIEHPKAKICYSKFHSLKPENIRDVSKSTMISSLCVYCQNVNLKLQKLNIPGLRTEYELFCKCTCKRLPSQKFRNSDCISKKCTICKDWETTLRKEISNKTNMKKEIGYLAWKNKTFSTKDGKKSTRRVLVNEVGTVQKCVDDLINDDLKNPLKRCTFFEHFYTQVYQQKMYKLCKKNAKPGIIIIIMDFSRNRDVLYQDEIKSSYWTRKQITMQRLVITHLSDITKHDAHFV